MKNENSRKIEGTSPLDGPDSIFDVCENSAYEKIFTGIEHTKEKVSRVLALDITGVTESDRHKVLLRTISLLFRINFDTSTRVGRSTWIATSNDTIETVTDQLTQIRDKLSIKGLNLDYYFINGLKNNNGIESVIDSAINIFVRMKFDKVVNESLENWEEITARDTFGLRS